MKAKSTYSGIVANTAAKGTIGIFSAIALFIVAFMVWSAAGVGGAIIDFFRGL